MKAPASRARRLCVPFFEPGSRSAGSTLRPSSLRRPPSPRRPDGTPRSILPRRGGRVRALRGQGDDRDVAARARAGRAAGRRVAPRPSPVPPSPRAPWMKSTRPSLSPRFVMPSSFGRPPAVVCRGTRPSRAARSQAPEGATVADRRRKGGGAPHADAGDRPQAPGSRVGAGKGGERRVQGGDAAVELAPFGAHVRDRLEHARAQPVGPRRHRRVGLALAHTPPLRVGDRAPQRDRTPRVEQGPSGRHHARARPVQRPRIEPIPALRLDRAQGRARRGTGRSPRRRGPRSSRALTQGCPCSGDINRTSWPRTEPRRLSRGRFRLEPMPPSRRPPAARGGAPRPRRAGRSRWARGAVGG